MLLFPKEYDRTVQCCQLAIHNKLVGVRHCCSTEEAEYSNKAALTNTSKCTIYTEEPIYTSRYVRNARKRASHIEQHSRHTHTTAPFCVMRFIYNETQKSLTAPNSYACHKPYLRVVA